MYKRRGGKKKLRYKNRLPIFVGKTTSKTHTCFLYLFCYIYCRENNIPTLCIIYAPMSYKVGNLNIPPWHQGLHVCEGMVQV